MDGSRRVEVYEWRVGGCVHMLYRYSHDGEGSAWGLLLGSTDGTGAVRDTRRIGQWMNVHTCSLSNSP